MNKDAPSVTTTIRFKAKELALLKGFSKKHSTSVSGLIRASIRLAFGIPEEEEGNIRAFHAITLQLTGVARNLNQITRAANAGKLKWNKSAEEEVEAVRVQVLEALALFRGFQKAAATRDLTSAIAQQRALYAENDH